MKTIDTPSPLVSVITTLEAANAQIHDIGVRTHEIERIENQLEEDIAKLRERASARIAPLVLEIKQKTTQVRLYANANRQKLTGDAKKHVTLPAGEFGWRTTPPKVTFGKVGEKKILAQLQAEGYDEYIRATYAIDHEALLRERPALSGIKYSQTERFFINPFVAKEPDFYPPVAVAKRVAK